MKRQPKVAGGGPEPSASAILKPKRQFLVIPSDLHTNSTRGLWPRGFELEEGNDVSQNRFQSSLWTWWLDFCSFAKTFTGGEYDLVINGDVVQGAHTKRDSQIITHSVKDMRKAAIQVIEPVLPSKGKVYIVRGTEWHEGKGGEDTEEIACDIGAEKDEVTGQSSHWVLWKKLGPFLGHFTHHVSVSPNYPLTALWGEIQRAKHEHIDNGQPLPDFQVRSHRHTMDHVQDGRFHVFVTPAWQLQTAYVVKKNPLALPDIGGLILWTEEGDEELHWKFRTYTLPLPKIY